MDLARIKSLIDLMAGSDLAEMEFAEGEWSLRLVRHGAGSAETPVRSVDVIPRAPAPPPVAIPVDTTPVDAVVSPMFGVVYLRPGPDAHDFVRPGQSVSANTIVCVVEAMKVFNEVRAGREGIIADILVATGQEVEAGQPVMRVQ